MEAVAALVFGAVTVTQIEISRAVVGSGVAILMLAYGVLLLLVARGVFLGRRWSRGAGRRDPADPAADRLQLPGQPDHGRGAGASPRWRSGTLIGLLHPRSTAVFVGPPYAAGHRNLRLVSSLVPAAAQRSRPAPADGRPTKCSGGPKPARSNRSAICAATRSDSPAGTKRDDAAAEAAAGHPGAQRAGLPGRLDGEVHRRAQ